MGILHEQSYHETRMTQKGKGYLWKNLYKKIDILEYTAVKVMVFKQFWTIMGCNCSTSGQCMNNLVQNRILYFVLKLERDFVRYEFLRYVGLR